MNENTKTQTELEIERLKAEMELTKAKAEAERSMLLAKAEAESQLLMAQADLERAKNSAQYDPNALATAATLSSTEMMKECMSNRPVTGLMGVQAMGIGTLGSQSAFSSMPPLPPFEKETLVCQNCNQLIPRGNYCLNCGIKLMMKCNECGTENPVNSNFCMNCGNKL